MEAMTDADLLLELETLEADRAKVQGQIEAYLACRFEPHDRRWHHRARHAMRDMRIRAGLIKQELERRKASAAKSERKDEKAKKHERFLAHQQELKDIKIRRAEESAAKMQRVKESNSEQIRQIAVFKTVAREVLGDEMYMYLWQLSHQRMASQQEVK